MPSFCRPEMMPAPPSATARTAAASVTIENTTSEAAATARGVGPSRMPAAINGSAFCLLRFQPVTAWPAAMSRGTMPGPMAPSPTKPMFMPSPRKKPRSSMMTPNGGKGPGRGSRAPPTHTCTPGAGLGGAVWEGLGAEGLGPAGVGGAGKGWFRGHGPGIEPRGLAAAPLDAENRLRGVVEHESLRRQEGEAEPWMQEAAAAHEAFARVLAVDHAVDAGEIGGLIAFAGAGRVELAGGRPRGPHVVWGGGAGGGENVAARGGAWVV